MNSKLIALYWARYLGSIEYTKQQTIENGLRFTDKKGDTIELSSDDDDDQMIHMVAKTGKSGNSYATYRYDRNKDVFDLLKVREQES